MSALNEIDDFLNGGLFLWLESSLPRPEIVSGYNSLLDGSIIYSVCLQIDPEPQHHLIKLNDLDGVTLSNGRAKNFDAIVKNLKALYEEELQQTVLLLPDCTILGHSPETKIGLEQMKLLLTLLLGAAVQCPNKELFIGRIKELDLETQHAIVELIKQVTDNQTLVLTQDSLEQLSPNKMYNHIIRLAKERDQYHSNWISSLAYESDPHSSSAKITQSNSTSSADNNHMGVELADLKSKLRKLRQELEEKSEAYMEVKEDVDHKTIQFEKLRNESQEWYLEARRAAAYRDEVDVLRERADRADRLDIEVQRFREKLSDAEFYKTRVEELREDNRLLLETKEMLEDQLLQSRKRSEHAMSLESDIIKYKQKLNNLALERDSDKNKFQDLLDENIQLQIATKNLQTNLDVENTNSDLEDESISGDNSLSEQLTNNAQSRALKLELENRRLNAALETMKESTFHESSNKLLELEKEKKKLSLKMEQIQENCNRMNQQNQELENVFKNALEENQKLQDSLDGDKQLIDKHNQDRELEKMKILDLEKHVESLNKDKQRIQTLSDSIQRRASDLERNVESKSKEIESVRDKLVEFEILKKDSYEVKTKFCTVEKENSNLIKEVTKLRENLEIKDVHLDENLSKLELQTHAIVTLTKNLENLSDTKYKIVELEKINNELQSQNKIDSETISTLQKDLVSGKLTTTKVMKNLEKLGLDNNEIENVDFNVENVFQKMVKNPETFKTVREIMLNYGKLDRTVTSSADICVLCQRKEIYTVEKEIDISPTSAAPRKICNDIQIDLIINETEEIVSSVSAQWKEQCDLLVIENQSLKTTNEQLQSDNARQNVEVSTLNSQIGSLTTQQVAITLANTQLAVEKDILVKKLDGVKQQHTSLMHDQVALQCLHDQLSSEYDALNKEKEILKVSLRDIRLDNRDLKDHKEALEKLVEELKTEIESMKTGANSLANLRAEHSKLKDDFRHLFTTSERLKEEYKNMHEQYRTIRTGNSQLKLQNTELSGDLNSRIDQTTSLEIELTKVTQKCEMLIQMNSNLDIDRRTLMDHVSQLLTQYHELLSHSLDDKKHYHDEEKIFTDKVNNLYRQKEKLEEKIMEHYRKLDSCSPKKKAFGSSLVKRVRKAGSDLMNKVPSRNNRRSWIEDQRLTQSNFTLGSESGGNESDNSNEDPNSTVSDTMLLQKYSKLRQSLPRKPKEAEDESLNVSSSRTSDEGTLTRGGVRSSLQISNSTPRKNISISNLDSTEVAGKFNLGTAGSRRTVYLGNELSNSKIAEPTGGSQPGTPTPTNENGTLQTENNEQQPSTFLMYNRISTTIGNTNGVVDSNSSPISNQKTNGDNLSTSGSKKGGSSNGKGKESAVWYEYGCV